MDYLTVAEARDLRGLRLVLTAHVPGPWGQASKALLAFRAVPFVIVAQTAGADNRDLVKWTGHRNAPIAIFDDEPPCTEWLEILFLAERLGSGPSLLPDDPADRHACLGICLEMAGYWGLGWCRRLSMWTLTGPAPTRESQRLRDQYGYCPVSAAAAPKRLRDILIALDRRLADQERRGASFLAADRPTAADLYWTIFSIMLDVPDHLVDRIPQRQRAMYSTVEPMISGLLTDRLRRLRDEVFDRVIGLPLEF